MFLPSFVKLSIRLSFFNGHKQLRHKTCEETIPKWACFSQIDHKKWQKYFDQKIPKLSFQKFHDSLHFCEKALSPKWGPVRELIKATCHPMNVFSIISILLDYITDNHTKVPARIWLSSKMVLVTTSLQPEQVHFKFWADFKLIYNNRDWLRYNNIILQAYFQIPLLD